MSGFILVRDIMSRNVKTVRTDDTVLDAVKKMNKFNIGSVIVTSNNRPVGIITETNVMQRIVAPRLDAGTVWTKDIMSSPLITIEETASVEEAARLMAEKQIKKLPIVKGDKLQGVVTTTDIVRASPTQLGILEELLKVG
ncbi:MAG: cyclic nucleotide-binding/CBS domain-containing protein [Candidatus Bathyarchaeia archaeon]